MKETSFYKIPSGKVLFHGSWKYMYYLTTGWALVLSNRKKDSEQFHTSLKWSCYDDVFNARMCVMCQSQDATTFASRLTKPLFLHKASPYHTYRHREIQFLQSNEPRCLSCAHPTSWVAKKCWTSSRVSYDGILLLWWVSWHQKDVLDLRMLICE